MERTHVSNFTDSEHATILAALRLYQGACMASDRNPALADIQTNSGTVKALDEAGIDALCERMNTRCSLDEAIEAMKAHCTFADAVRTFGDTAETSPYVERAHELSIEGAYEVDDTTVVSEGDDDGAYVMCWQWIEGKV